jgi:hypothetical protein
VAVDANLESCNRAFGRFGDARAHAPIDQTVRRQQQEIKRARVFRRLAACHPRQRLGELWTDPGQAFDRFEQGIELKWSHETR